jgi:hypothetical protein
LHFVGWVEPTPGFVGFRCTQPNLQFVGDILKCETQQRLILGPSPEVFSTIRQDAPRPKAGLIRLRRKPETFFAIRNPQPTTRINCPAVRYLSCTLSNVKKRKQALIITRLTAI